MVLVLQVLFIPVILSVNPIEGNHSERGCRMSFAPLKGVCKPFNMMRGSPDAI